MNHTIKIFQIDAFTDKIFGGNPAAVCVLEDWIEKEKMQNIAAENNLAETAFVVRKEKDYELRWFTPTVEVDLCGHATLAAAHVLFNHYDYPGDKIIFHSLNSGVLSVVKNEDNLTLDFPKDTCKIVETPPLLIDAFRKVPVETYQGLTDYLLIYSSQKEIEEIDPDIPLIAKVKARGVIVSAPGDKVDFVSRFFAPQVGVDEDPVTGSAHTTLTPVWSEKLGKKKLSAEQLSNRKGRLTCELNEDRVKITGKAVTYLKGEITI